MIERSDYDYTTTEYKYTDEDREAHMDRIAKALEGIGKTLFWVAFWLFLIMLNLMRVGD